MLASAVKERARRSAKLCGAGLLAVLVLSCGGPSSTPNTSPHIENQDASSPGLKVSLTDWGLSSIDDIGFLTVALFEHDSAASELSLYDLRKVPPKASTANARVWRSEAPILTSGGFLLSRFDRGNYNRLGGTFGSFAKAPSTGDARLLGGNVGLRFRFTQAEKGFTGVWFHLFDDRASSAERTYLHTGAASHLTFEIRGLLGDEPLLLAVADREWLEKGDARAIGPVSAYLESGAVTRTWQRVLVPLSDIPPDVEHEELASLVLQVASKGTGEVAIRNMGLLASADARLPIDTIVASKTSRAKRDLRRAMWVWQTEALLGDVALRDQLLATCKSQNITDVFLQLVPATLGTNSWSAMLDLVADLHKVGVRVDALDGSPKYSQAKNHHVALEIAGVVVASNRIEPAQRRFDGMRFDIEPYLLPGFSGPAKASILGDYLSLLDKLHAVASSGELPLGADIPFWFDGVDRYNKPVAVVRGRPVSELVMDRVDNIAVMAYRTRIYGPDGVIAHAIDEIEYAEATGKAVFVGLETGPLPNEHVRDFDAKPQEAADRLLVWTEGRRQLRVVHYRAEEHKKFAAARAEHAGARVFYMRSETIAPASKITFNRDTLASLEEATLQIEEELGLYDSTAGIAIHAFGSLHKLRDTRVAEPPNASP